MFHLFFPLHSFSFFIFFPDFVSLSHFLPFLFLLCVFFFACSEWHLRKSKILHKHRTNESNTSKEEKREILILCNDELFIKYKSMSMATLCHKHIFTANTSWCMMYEVRQKKRQRTHTHTLTLNNIGLYVISGLPICDENNIEENGIGENISYWWGWRIAWKSG